MAQPNQARPACLTCLEPASGIRTFPTLDFGVPDPSLKLGWAEAGNAKRLQLRSLQERNSEREIARIHPELCGFSSFHQFVNQQPTLIFLNLLTPTVDGRNCASLSKRGKPFSLSLSLSLVPSNVSSAEAQVMVSHYWLDFYRGVSIPWLLWVVQEFVHPQYGHKLYLVQAATPKGKKLPSAQQ